MQKTPLSERLAVALRPYAMVGIALCLPGYLISQGFMLMLALEHWGWGWFALIAAINAVVAVALALFHDTQTMTAEAEARMHRTPKERP